ncbi:hypothetical protein N656DRAFT_796926 [Canariomyces notabilis]|uniref:Uncharacterized protein n=1 Tax=Canariomyces notabilis TaxID=2074819 RepID=A0AAN6YTX5_9PEZI|nr:hypothetical protein N656DRAFT_796926 [Canariomyces arenarius]
MADHPPATQSGMLDHMQRFYLITPGAARTLINGIELPITEPPDLLECLMAMAHRHSTLLGNANAARLPVPPRLQSESAPRTPRMPQPSAAGDGMASAAAGPGVKPTAGNGTFTYERVTARGNALQFNAPVGTDPAIFNCNISHRDTCASDWSVMFNAPVLADAKEIVKLDIHYKERRDAAAAAAPGQG